MKVLTTIFTFIILNNCLAQSNYCIPVPPDSVDGHSVSMVRLQSLDTSFTGPYYQFIRDSVHHETCFLKPGSTYKIHLKSGTHSISTLGAWIDWNNDTTLSSTEKLGEFTTSSVNERDSISFTVPLNSAKGKLRLRVRASNSSTLNACNPNLSGQTIDFTITILNPAYDTDFYPGWRFSNTGNNYIDRIKIGTIDNQNSGAPTGPVYHDYSYMTTNITACISNNIYITGKFSSNDDSVYAYIDFNKNGIFEVLELIANSSFTAGQHTDSVQFSTPSVSGICRLRIEYVSSSGIIEVEDYSVNIVNTSILNFPQAIIGSDLLFDCNNGCYFYGCSGPITFYDYGCGKPTLRYWSVPGASPSTSTLQNPTFNFPSSGIYNITLKDSNSIGSDIITAQVYITAPVINFNLGTNTTVCTGDSLLLTAPSGDPIIDCYSYVWSTGATTREIYVRNSGTYSVILSTCHSGECPAYDTIDVNFSPAIYNVTGGGSYCIGSNGSEVRLSDSQTGILYQLYNNNNPVGSAVAGTGSLISFGLHTTSGTYTIRATNSVISCTKTMSGFVNINAVTPPDIYTVTGGGGYC